MEKSANAPRWRALLGRHRWLVSIIGVVLIAGAILLPGLGEFGIWEPQERQLADKVAPRPEIDPALKGSGAPKPAPPADGCWKTAPDDATARTLSARAMRFGRDTIDDSDAGRRLPFALLGILCVLATAGIAMRAAGPRAGVIAGVVMLSMPLLVLQSRQLTTEIGTATGAALTIYGLMALGSLERVLVGTVLPLGIVGGRTPVGTRATLLLALDGLVGAAAVVAGIWLGFQSGGALLGVLVPVGAFAAAGLLGVPTIVDGVRWVRNMVLAFERRANPRWAAGKQPWPYTRGDNTLALVATAVAGIVIAALAYQLFSLKTPMPGLIPPQREVLDHAIVPSGCWSSALGGVWRPDDDLRYAFDSTFEQIAYGTFPWGILAPLAFAALLGSADAKRKQVGAVALAWAGAAWIASEVFSRKVGFTLWAGFPALALAIGVWVDSMLVRPKRDPQATEKLPAGRLLVGLFFALAILDLGKDLQSFTEKLVSLLVGGDSIAYPTMSHLAILPTRVWLLVLGLLIGVGFAVAIIVWPTNAHDLTGPVSRRTAARRVVAVVAAGVTCVSTIVMAAFWAFGWQPALAEHLSSKAMFDTYKELAKRGDSLVIMGDMGDAPHDYAPDTTPEVVSNREQIVQAIGRPNRVFAVAPQTELCQLHREIGGKPYFVVEDRNVRSLLLSNRVDGATDKNPLRTAILHTEPTQMQFRPKGKVVWDGRIQLLGWDMPKSVGRGAHFEVKMYYKVLQPVGGAWRVLFHFDGPLRFNGDHEPINGRCQTSTWQPGDFIVDSYWVTAGGGAFANGVYDVWTGFFTGSNPNWKNMPVSEAPGDMRDRDDRVKITTITLD